MGRIQEVFDVITLTKQQIASVGLTRESFLNPKDDTEDLVAEGIMNRVLRVTEEAGHIEEGIAAQYGFDSAGARGVRNRLAHVYGDVDRDIIWRVIEEDFDILLEACISYCDDNGIDLRAPSAGEAL